MGVIPPSPEFLHALRKLTDAHGMLLIFDEVISGFRVQYGGAQTLYDIKPDLTILGKIIGGGLPVGAYGGAKDIMKMIAPSGPVYQAGTLSGNPLAVTAGIETLKRLKKPGTYEQLEQRSVALSEGVGNAARKAGVPLTQTRVSSMMMAMTPAGGVSSSALPGRSCRKIPSSRRNTRVGVLSRVTLSSCERPVSMLSTMNASPIAGIDVSAPAATVN